MSRSRTNAAASPDSRSNVPSLSFIIPTYNAGTGLANCLESLLQQPDSDLDLEPEILVSDGGSCDGTLQLARDRGCRILQGPPGRGGQLHRGALASRGEWLFFLHADCRLPADWPTPVERFMTTEKNRNMAGHGRLQFASAESAARRVERLANWRAEKLGLPYGDQGLLIHRSMYDRIGGYRDMPLMEDVELVRRLGRRRLKPLGLEVTTSAEKYEQQGWWKRPSLNLCRLALFLLGVSPERLARGYR
ncbi:TIGR04283 family arsenosugar biosynthesis glycosyltransferase [Fodinicurvata fenggangensis]|uniref:TIGR04283 family arsenosugar biosynthesis glycosyltransferase n=1 Tax=Fodinicurvata fenggangensis TaxID=1121830 RepID=UPI00068D7471|nr:TIGR04283 family arsenosugar biosynthesis glycosyltransferase [Fodinicurvata fenggangensis]